MSTGIEGHGGQTALFSCEVEFCGTEHFSLLGVCAHWPRTERCRRLSGRAGHFLSQCPPLGVVNGRPFQMLCLSLYISGTWLDILSLIASASINVNSRDNTVHEVLPPVSRVCILQPRGLKTSDLRT